MPFLLAGTIPRGGNSSRKSTNISFALREIADAIARGDDSDPGPASLELAVRAAYPLVIQGRLNADRGTANNEQPDRRLPGEILDVMRRTVRGVRQLEQSLVDFQVNRHIRAVDEAGVVKSLSDGAGEQVVTDIYSFLSLSRFFLSSVCCSGFSHQN